MEGKGAEARVEEREGKEAEASQGQDAEGQLKVGKGKGKEQEAAPTLEEMRENERAREEMEEEERRKEGTIALTVKWNGKSFHLLAQKGWTVEDVKNRLFELTNVQARRQKLMGLVKGKLPTDAELLENLGLGRERAFMMMGTPDENIIKDPSEVEGPDVVNDFDVDYSEGKVDVSKNPENLTLLRKYTESTTIQFIHPPRSGKRLLVLDLDYTIFDCKSAAETIAELARPGMHEFLTSVYQEYDIVIWSQTSWKWLEMKITSLGLLNHPNYKICFVLDRTSMFKVKSQDSNGNPWYHEVKALGIIWNKLPDLYSPANSIHVDDLGRNFAMNPQSGFKIKAFKNAPLTRHYDQELYSVARYLHLISKHETNFQELNHKSWKKYMEKF